MILDSYLYIKRINSCLGQRLNNEGPARAVGGKRQNENDNFQHDEIEEPPEKMRRFEIDYSDYESSVCQPPDLENFVRKHMKKHVGAKAIKERVLTDNPVSENADKTPALDIYIKELIKGTVSGNWTLCVAGFLTNIQEVIDNVLGPAT